MKLMKWVLFVLALFFTCMLQLSRQEFSAKALAPVKRDNIGLGPYWFEGKAEISHYTLSQNRYRDVHPGEAVLVFVTEPFLTDKQVKNEKGQLENSTTVLKLNAIQRFTTGIYDYSVMTSVFTPEDLKRYPHSSKQPAVARIGVGKLLCKSTRKKTSIR
ncbi:MAG: hypothetical protein IPO07_07345 [Haliscomenobacter sp.]|nr:hypothetical protein [Haliscomenobacter sp.]MBK9488612.1 hypothetical protein [Haliscomenobacter sp.]